MGNEQDGDATLGQGTQQGQDPGLDRDVQGGCGLIGDEDRRVAGHRQSDAGTLELSAGELVGVGASNALSLLTLAQSRQGQQVQDPRVKLTPRPTAVAGFVGAHSLTHLGGDGLQRVQRRRRLLEDHAGQATSHVIQDAARGTHELNGLGAVA